MDFRLLEYFLRVAELGSINKAAADLLLSQPALSRHIASLEHEMGAQLFTRTQGGVQLTEPGRLLSDRARPLMRQFYSLKEAVGEAAAGQLAIGIPPSWQFVFTTPFVEQLVRTHPGVKLRVYEGVSNVLREYMCAGALDLCITSFNASVPAGFTQTGLVREPLVLVGRKEQGLCAQQPVSILDLNGLDLVLPSRPNIIRTQIEQRLLHLELVFKQVVEADTMPLCLSLIRKGVGNTVVPAAVLSALSWDTSISWAPVKGLDITWALYENDARMHSPAVREGRRLVFATLNESLSGTAWFGAECVGKTVATPKKPIAKVRTRPA
ncbi:MULTISPECIES: LysR family transcriptional regulator [unclassified Pseudomonas]|uniref:LysR family transcriptional regulator n=1 Tax=unclassified Pseudomonas TaxID=196821 RepID=UPI0008715E76|nr:MULTISPECIES: LysR family transcriptional regulator [unclassified Pseudomonas]SCW57052.1 LysR family transcriptional regulator, nitrogen assimilation regulatory protein [Pseudomonas sp. NFACC56-3]SFK30818.1 LysR family transcriptional regulator, nitrogen assimilation regulatory protein [Pseudomonas sp. NFACC52]